MANTWLKSQVGLRRVSKGVRRFLSNVAEEMRERVGGSFEDAEAAETDLAQADWAEGVPEEEGRGGEEPQERLPEGIQEAEDRARQIREAEASQVAQWREELAKRLAGRESSRVYFEEMTEEALGRFAEQRAAALAEIRGGKAAGEAMEEAVMDPEAEGSPVAGGQAEGQADGDAPEVERDFRTNGEAGEPEEERREYVIPDTGLLQPADVERAVFVEEAELERQKRVLQETLDSFAVDALVYDAIVGPRVTQFRVQPGTGVRVEAISALERNICLALASTHIRIQAPIPGEPFVGIEVGNTNAFPVKLRSMLESRSWQSTTQEIPLVLGMDIQGKIMLADLAKAPHLLIAGATGSGKSVCMSNLVLSLVYRFSPAELELVMIDPKRVEFGMFQEMPHLIHPVVTEPKMAVLVLKWVVQEMSRRYEVLAEKRVRNLAGYNAKAEREGFARMPYMVVIIDELADLMMTSRGDAEDALTRIAQLSRAVGIHTIIATQRPSVNVITGVIKANYPTRIAFQVSSQIDSRTILDGKGAESLLGRGDLLFNPPGVARLIRIQSPMVEDEEIMRVMAAISAFRGNRDRVEVKAGDAGEEGDGEAVAEAEDGEDPLVRRAMEIIAESQKASTSYLQRRLRIGYNRAATLMEELEDRGVVGPQIGSTPREVFIGREEM